MTASDAAKKTILIVDDEPDVVAYLKALLEDNGYQTISAADGNKAMEKLKAGVPDLITLDISMPEKSGIRFYREIKGDESLAKIPVVVVTGVTGFGGKPEEFQKFLESRRQVPPPDAFIPKPIEQQDLLKEIERLIK